MKKTTSILSNFSLAFTGIAFFIAGSVIIGWRIEEPFALCLIRIAAHAGLILCGAGIVLAAGDVIIRHSKTVFLKGLFKSLTALAAAGFLILFLQHSEPVYRRELCRVQLRNLSIALHDYAQANGHYPPAQSWCDALLTFTTKNTSGYPNGFKANFTCPAECAPMCSYAMNPFARSSSNPQTVLLFEAKAGWDQFGGPELATFKNHNGYCCVLFVGGQNRCVDKDEFDTLKWR